LLDDQHRPISLATVRRLHQIPVAEPDLGGNELAYVTSCLRDGWISSQGPFVRKFEQEFARRIGVPHAIATSSGTTALHLALLALGIGPGDEVIVPDLTFAASINAVLYCGASPVLVDVDRETWNIDPNAIQEVLTSRTKAIMVVHLYGQPAAMAELAAIAARHGLMIVEDAAEALGATYQGRQVGGFGRAAAFSFYGNKLITTGEGGMVVTLDAAVADRIRVLRDHGMNREKRYWHDVVGYNYRMTNLQAAIGVAQLERIDDFIARKIEIERRYREELAGIPGLVFMRAPQDAASVCWLFSCIVDPELGGRPRDALISDLTEAGIDSRPVFYPLHSMPLYRQYAGNRQLPSAEWLSGNGLSLPSAVNVSNAEIDYVCNVLKRILTKRSQVPASAHG
jgi:perosamine synthetase